jgi:uncharacterized protein (TIGR03435 family)
MTSTLATAALAVSRSLPLSITLKATVVLAIAFAAVTAARRCRAAIRHAILSAAFAALAALPIVIVSPASIAIGVPPPVDRVGRIHAQDGVDLMASDPTPAISNAATAPDSASIAGSHGRLSLAWLLQVVWLLGVAISLVPVAVALLEFRRLRRRGTDWQMADMLTRSLSGREVPAPARFVLHDDVMMPLTFGTWQPVVAFPAAAARWDIDTIENALAHELEHVRRRDAFVQMATRCVCSAYWFHPVVWWAWRRLRLESERACDDVVITRSDRATYAQQLLTLARGLGNRRIRHAPSMANRTDLSRRVMAVLDDRTPRGRLTRLPVLAVGAVAIATVVAVAPLRAVEASGRIALGSRPLAVVTELALGLKPAPFDTPTAIAVERLPAAASPIKMRVDAARPQAAAAEPSFANVSIFFNENGRFDVHRGPMMSGTEFVAENVQARWLILAAYGMNSYRVIGGPDWIGSDYFIVSARAPNAVSASEYQAMLRKLLADRFQLRIHTETRSTPVYALVVSSPDGAFGPQLQRASVDCPTLRAAAGPRPTAPPCGMILQPGHTAGRGFPIGTLAGWLSHDAGRMVVDETGLDGAFDFDLVYTPEQLRHHPPDRFPNVDPEGPSIFAAASAQLGLTLEPRDTLGEVLVIDSIQRPMP